MKALNVFTVFLTFFLLAICVRGGGGKYEDFTIASCDGDCAVKQEHLVTGSICADKVFIGGELFDPNSMGGGHCDGEPRRKCKIWRPICGDKCNKTRTHHQHNEHIESYPYYGKRSEIINAAPKEDGKFHSMDGDRRTIAEALAEGKNKQKRSSYGYGGEDDDEKDDKKDDDCKFKSIDNVNLIRDRNLDCLCDERDNGPLQCYNKNSLFVCVTLNCTGVANNGTLPLQLSTTYDGQPALCFLNLDLVHEFGLVLDDRNGDGNCNYTDCCSDCGNAPAKGEPGLGGDIGPTGPMGPSGPIGPTGLRGLKGDRGKKGKKGEQGPHGKDGIEGPLGPRGPKGPKGKKGTPGIDNECWQLNKPKILEDECFRNTHFKKVIDKDTCVVDAAMPACEHKKQYTVYEYEEFNQRFICVNRTSRAVLKKKIFITDRNGDGLCNAKDCVDDVSCSPNVQLPLLCVTHVNGTMCQQSPDSIFFNKANGQYVICGDAYLTYGLQISDINNDGVCDSSDCNCRGCEGSTVAPCLCSSAHCPDFGNDVTPCGNSGGTFNITNGAANATLGNCLSGQEWKYNDGRITQEFVCSSEGWISVDKKSLMIGSGAGAACGPGGDVYGTTNCGAKITDTISMGGTVSHFPTISYFSVVRYPFHTIITDCSFIIKAQETGAISSVDNQFIDFEIYSSGIITPNSFAKAQLKKLIHISNVNFTDDIMLNTFVPNPSIYTSPLTTTNVPICSGYHMYGLNVNLNNSDSLTDWYGECNTKDLICTDLQGNIVNCDYNSLPFVDCSKK